MPTVPLPIKTGPYRNVDEVEPSVHSVRVVDAYTDELGATVMRPGLGGALSTAEGEPCRGLYWWNTNSYAIGVYGQSVYKITGPVLAKSSLGSAVATGTGRAVFTTDGTYVIIAHGGKIIYTDGSTVTTVSDADAPTSVTHVAYLDDYILCNSVDTNTVYYFDLSSFPNITATNFFSAAGDADYVTALHVLNLEIFLLGPNSVEIWENDGETPFSRVPGGFRQTGCIAPYSVVVTDDSLWWLSDQRQFVRYKEGRIETVSTQYDRDIDSWSHVGDCYGRRMTIDGKPFLFFTFPSVGKTLVYNMGQKDWHEWGSYQTSGGFYKQWRVSGYCYAPAWGKHLAGDTWNDNIWELSSNYNQDGQDPIRAFRLMGNYNYGTSRRKRSTELRLTLKRGDTATGLDAAQLMVRWRDDGRRWSNIHHISLGATGEYEMFRRMFPRGVFRYRQYEFSASDNVPFILVDAEEDVDVLR